MTFRRGRRLGLDIGSVRIGVAQCDPDGILATPVTTVYRRDGDEQALGELHGLIAEHEPVEIIVGLPTSLDGQQRAAAAAARAFAVALAARSDIQVRALDERFTTTQAHSVLQSAGRSSRQRREIVDSVAAVMILQAAVDQEKRTGLPAGEPVDPHDTGPHEGAPR